MYKLGNLKLKSRVFLAPMLEYNDVAFRELCKKAGAGLCWTGMCNPLSRQKFDFSDFPAIQLFCDREEGVEEFIKKHNKEASLFDFNLGCPSKKAEGCNLGSYMQDLNKIERILKIIRKNTSKPVSIKIRKSKDSFKLLKLAEKYCDAICIHPRTKEQGYSGEADIQFALDLKKKSKIPVIYSGDVNETNAQTLLEKFDFIMIGRACLGNPCIFAKVFGKKCKFEFKDYLKIARKHKIDFQQIKIHALMFTKGKENAGRMRENISKAKSLNEIISI